MSSGRVNPLFREVYGSGSIVVSRRYPIVVKRLSVGATRSDEGYFMSERARFESGEKSGIRRFFRRILYVRGRSSGRNQNVKRSSGQEVRSVRRGSVDEFEKISGVVFGPNFRFYVLRILIESEVGVDGSREHEGENQDRYHGFRQRECRRRLFRYHPLVVIWRLLAPVAVSWK